MSKPYDYNKRERLMKERIMFRTNYNHKSILQDYCLREERDMSSIIRELLIKWEILKQLEQGNIKDIKTIEKIMPVIEHFKSIRHLIKE